MHCYDYSFRAKTQKNSSSFHQKDIKGDAMIKVRMNNGKGFTLVELIITMAILAIVLSAAFSILQFNNRSYALGTNKVEVQSGLRTSASFLSDKLRYAGSVQIFSAMPVGAPVSGTEYLYVENGVLKYYDGSTAVNIPGSGSGTNVGMTINRVDDKTIHFKLTGSYQGQVYDLDTSIFMMNCSNLSSGPGTAVSFKPAAFAILHIGGSGGGTGGGGSPTDITACGVTELVVPEKNKTAVTTAVSGDSTKYKFTSITWSPSLNNGKFHPNTIYSATIVLTSNPGYRFPASGISNPSATEIGSGKINTGTTGGGYITGNTLTFTVVYPSTN